MANEKELLKIDGGKRRLVSSTKEEWQKAFEYMDIFESLAKGFRTMLNAHLELYIVRNGKKKTTEANDEYFKVMYSEMEKTIMSSNDSGILITHQCYSYLYQGLHGLMHLLNETSKGGYGVQHKETGKFLSADEVRMYAEKIHASKPVIIHTQTQRIS